MIGAMPAVAVRHERRRQENRIKRPSQLYFGGHWTQPSQASPLTPNSYIQNKHIETLPEVYLCGKISGLHTVVICLLLGAIILVVGLVQLAPGATSDHKLALLISGSVLLLFDFKSIFNSYSLNISELKFLKKEEKKRENQNEL